MQSFKLPTLVCTLLISGTTFAGNPVSSVGKGIGDAVESTGTAIKNTGEGAIEYTSDTAVTTAVKSALALDGTMPTTISVTTIDGNVMLSGEVADEAAKQRATEIASGVAGVKSVDTSGLMIKNSN